jgi:hypothetical protein
VQTLLQNLVIFSSFYNLTFVIKTHIFSDNNLANTNGEYIDACANTHSSSWPVIYYLLTALIIVSTSSIRMARAAGGADYDFIFKLVLIGDSSVGKVNIICWQILLDSIMRSNFSFRVISYYGLHVMNFVSIHNQQLELNLLINNWLSMKNEWKLKFG